MTKFQRFQKISSIVPYYSSIFVFIVTMIELKRRKASPKLWFHFILTFFLSGIGVFILNSFIMTGQHKILNIIASGLLLAVANIICVDIQLQCTQKGLAKNHTQDKKDQLIVYYVLGGIFSLCMFAAVVMMVLNPSIVIEDTNGNNTNLAVIEMDEILTTVNHFSSFRSFSSQYGAKTTVRGDLEEYDYEKVTFRCKKISGVKTLQATKTECDKLILNIESVLETGNLEIFIIVDNKYYDTVAVGQMQTIVLDNVTNRTVIVKIAAESANMDISITRKIN